MSSNNLLTSFFYSKMCAFSIYTQLPQLTVKCLATYSIQTWAHEIYSDVFNFMTSFHIYKQVTQSLLYIKIDNSLYLITVAFLYQEDLPVLHNYPMIHKDDTINIRSRWTGLENKFYFRCDSFFTFLDNLSKLQCSVRNKFRFEWINKCI